MQDAIILYENGKAIGGEGHPTNASDITFDNADTDLVSENVEGAIKEVNAKTSGVEQKFLAWTNSSPTASFASQIVTLDSDDYDCLEGWFLYSTSYGTQVTGKCEKTALGGVVEIVGSNGSIYGVHRRHFYPQTDKTKVQIDDDTFFPHSSAATSVHNGYLIPYKIYRVKIL